MSIRITAIMIGLVGVVPAVAAQSPDVVGQWEGHPVHNGQTGRFVLTLSSESDGRAATISMPQIDAWDVPVGEWTALGDTVRIGSWAATYDRQSGTLTATLPGAMVPVHTIPITFRRVTTPARSPPTPPRAPVRPPEWTRQLDTPVLSDPALAGEMVLIGDDAGHVHALAFDGGERWVVNVGGAVRAPIVVAGDVAYLHTDDGHLTAMEALTGGERWRVRVEPAVDRGAREEQYDFTGSGAAVVGGTVFVGGNDGTVTALDRRTGARQWQIQTDGAVTTTPAVGGGLVYVGSFDGHVYGLDAQDGTVRWSIDTGAPVTSSPVFADDRVIVGSRSYDIFGLDPPTGRVRWNHYYWFSWIESSFTAADGAVYVGSSDGQQITALGTTDGAVRWQFDTGGAAWPRPAVTADAVYTATHGVRDYISPHRAAVWALNREDGVARWTFPMEGRPGESRWGVVASPVVAGDRVIVADLRGQVLAFRR